MQLADIWSWIQQNGILAAAITGTIALIFNQRQKNIERFYAQSDETLEKLLEPMYYSLKEIKDTLDETTKIGLIENFFNEFSYKKGGLSKLRNIVLIDQITEVEDCFKEFSVNNSEENKKKLLLKIGLLELQVRKEYRNIFVSLNKNYNWYKILFKTNFLWAAVFMAIRWIKETLTFIVGASLVSLLVFLIDRISGNNVFNEEWTRVNLSITLFSIVMLYIFWMTHLVILKDTMQRKDEISLFQGWFSKTRAGKWINRNVWEKIDKRIEERRARRTRNITE
ncbi:MULTISPECIES: hypothetical protein [Bacillus]|uniref:Uncharacterized protein n=1 Tax=Bacillus cabrialesii subsp. tritici TaxID=2944916 RepID=A0ABT9DP03_9BACI|nr:MULTISPECIES: hypothetical protein [Bacillus]MCY8110972.1 hypothetical protein [Bacillus spizizenii]MDO8226410.1 hypothetical protein [Bacillus cabrialesii subsp. tritici]UTL77897.1 hypothetical protein NLW79_06580 [Bacillus halotolerans]WJE44344.1 hypothetical protein QRD86_07205 [Bacillus halotolerans]WPC81895.1 hypothetical protein RA179_06595 [Bacillus halotolerans]